MALKIYFAGPNVFHPEAKQMEQRISDFCKSHDIEALIPGDSGIDWLNRNKKLIAKQIFEINRNHILDCDAVIANSSPFRGACIDDGTAWEIGFAAALQKPIVTYGSGLKTTEEIISNVSGIENKGASPQRDRDNFLIENFGFQSNLMIACSVIEHFHCDFDCYKEIIRAINKPVQCIQNWFSEHN